METENNKTTITNTRQPKIRIAAMLDGFPVTVEIRGKADLLQKTLANLKAIGAQPPTQAAQASAPANATDGPPLCPVHRTPMKPSAKPGGFFCSKKAKGGAGYCDQTA